MTDVLVVPRLMLDREEPWTTPAGCTPVRLRRATDGGTPRLTTNLSVWFDDECLDLLFSAADDYVVSTYRKHDAPLYEEDVVEAFLAPESRTRYFEIEVSPNGTTFDALIHSPDGVRSTMRAERDWTCEGLFAAIRRITESDGSVSMDVLIRIPFESLGRPTPADDEVWSANFFRIDRHPEKGGDEFSAWQPTMKKPADFHVAASFGTLCFRH